MSDQVTVKLTNPSMTTTANIIMSYADLVVVIKALADADPTRIGVPSEYIASITEDLQRAKKAIQVLSE